MRKIKKLTIILLVLAILTGMAVVSSFPASAVTSDDVIKTVLNNRSVWNTSGWDYSNVFFADFDFDGKLEIMAGNQQPLSSASYDIYKINTTNNKLEHVCQTGATCNMESIYRDMYYDKTNKKYCYVYTSDQYRYPVKWTAINRISAFSGKIKIEPIFLIYEVQEGTYGSTHTPYSITYYMYDEKGNQKEVSFDKFSDEYISFYKNLSEVKYTHKYVTIQKSDSYTTAYNKLKQSYNAFGYNDSNPTSVRLNRGTLTLGVGEKYGLIKTVSPSSANQACTWSSSNSSVASVDSSGKVTAKKSGTANITVKTTNGKTATCKVTVKPAPTSVKVNPASLTLGKGETYTISQSTNSGSYAWGFSWSSSNTSVATVKKGSANKATVTAKGVGTATITIKTYNGKTAQCKVTVKNAPTSVTTNPTSLILGKGEKYTISENTNSGAYANAANLKWSTTNSNVATVTKGSGNKATITAKGNGTAYIKISLYNGKTAQCKVTVKNAPSSVKTNPTSVTLGKGETYVISESTNSGAYANATNLKWTTTNSSVATVTKGEGNKAVITAKGVGTAYIKITLYNGKTAQCKVTVKNAPTSVKINPASITLGKGETCTISESTNSGAYANAANLKWSTTNPNVVTVTKGSANKATITAKGNGTAYIKITLYNGKTAQCKVTVTNRKVYRLDNMSTYNGSRYFSSAESGTLYSNNYVKFLPSSIRNTAGIFTIAGNKIYYVEKKSGSGIQRTNVYRCDIDGKNKKLIVNDYFCNKAGNPSKSLIVNNKLYYKYYDGKNYGTKYIDLTNNQTKFLSLPDIPYCTNNGIGYYASNNELFCYDFISGKTEKLIAKNGSKSINIGVVIDYDDGYVYYSNTDFSSGGAFHGFYRMNISNKSKEFITKFHMEGSAAFKGNNMYYSTYENNSYCMHKYDLKSKKDAFFCSMKDCNMDFTVIKDEDCLLVNELCRSGNYLTQNIYCISFDGKTKTKVASFSTKLP